MNGKNLFLIFLLAILAALPAVAIEPISKCDALAAWAAGLEKLPADYESFTALEPGQRSAVYGRLSHSQRAALWNEQLTRELAQNDWNEAQRALIVENRAFATAENLAAMDLGVGTTFEVAQARLEHLKARVKDAFPHEEGMRLFHALGPKEKVSRIQSGLGRRCDCTEGYTDACGPIGIDQCILGNCTDPVLCGYMWSHVCDSYCTYCPGGC